MNKEIDAEEIRVEEFVLLVEDEARSEYPNRDRVLDACKWLRRELEAQAKQIQQQYDKGWRDGSDAQDKADHEHIIKPLEAENRKLKNQKEYIYKPEIAALKDKIDKLRGIAHGDSAIAIIEQLEEGAFAANEEAQARNDRIKQLEGERVLIKQSEAQEHGRASEYFGAVAEAKEALRLLRKEFVELAAEKQRLEAENRWIPTVNPPDNIDWDKKVLALEHESEIPKIMTMAEIFLDEGSEVEYWKPIILPDKSLQKEAKE